MIIRHLISDMKRLPALTMMALSFGLMCLAQSSNPAPPSGAPTSHVEKQNNAASATQDNSAISGDQVTKPAGVKSSTVIGCLDSPDAEGHLTLRSMQYRAGVDVVGPNDLETAAGQKVKLTGQWVAVSQSQDATSSQDASNNKKNRRFQATSFEVLADKCPPPSETTPFSKKKQKEQKTKSASQNHPQ